MTRVVTVNEGDEIRIQRHGGSGSVTIHAERVVAIADIFRWMFVQEDWDFSLFEVEGEYGERAWECTVGNIGAGGNSPWDAMCALADKCRK